MLAVTRRGMDKVRTAGRETTPFELIVRGPGGTTKRVLARAVIDASGTWRDPNPLGAGPVNRYPGPLATAAISLEHPKRTGLSD